ncbi:flagellar hook-length control protein FliK [Rhizobium herbae]|uniref:Flagellar hook-length control protein FliK n=1 Tax=Rhizobium herbae TaxID=508661 RepID=A0ABS4EV89_9HYPH|nr:flagellar hook-length control protein FliK [Rhizobium herbae]MBP1861874.1 flagellar hook-length control protein FliK [Rhizobium herbae]
MTFVDDNLLGTSPIRSAKSGAKSAGKSQDMDAANQRAAFENAFADAGKKKQPVVSISAKPAPESGLPVSQNLSTSAANIPATEAEAPATEKDVSSSRGKNADVLAPDIGDPDTSEDEQVSRRGFVPKNDGLMKPAIGNSSDTALRAPAKTMPTQDVEQDPAVAEGSDQKLKFALMLPDGKADLLSSMGLAGVGEDATIDVDGPVGEKVAGLLAVGLLKDAKTHLSKHNDLKAEKADETPPSKSAGDAADATSADVSQLLTLLDTAQRPVDASQSVRAETTPAMSEFQALAERAGKAKTAPKDATASKTDGGVSADANAVKNATKAGSDQVFRFARADGKGQAVSMNLASDGDKTVVKNDVPATSAKAETVTVLEARRYLGLAPTSNASAVTSQIASNPEWARALQPSAGAAAPLTQASTGKVLNTLKIQMHPIDLGMVTATLRLKDDELHVEIKVETGDAFRQLSDDQSAMVKALRAQGFAVDQVNIVFNSSDSSSSNAQQQAQPQAGQQGREAAGDSTGQGKSQRNDNGGQQQGRERWTGNEGTGDASSGAELNRAGDVYM